MKKLLLSTALVSMFSTHAMAEGHAQSPFLTEAAEGEVMASNFIGMRVYAAENTWETPDAMGAQTEWNDIGEINDVILARDGAVRGVLVDIGGFLGIGERQVAVDMGQIQFVADSSTDDVEDFFLVFPAGRAVLEGTQPYAAADRAEAFVGETLASAETMADQAIIAGENAVTRTGEAVSTAMAEVEAATDDTLITAEQTEFSSMQATEFTAEDLTGARVYAMGDNWVGEVSEVILDVNGEAIGAVVDVGGFLGIGEKPVMLDMAELNVITDASGVSRVDVPLSEDELEALPAYQG